eukprot:Ihof_evm1s283 gene=Ihof_evmTU1s283
MSSNSEQMLEKIPNMGLAQLKFKLNHADEFGIDKEELKKELLGFIEKDNMACFYEELCTEFNWPMDTEFKNKMVAITDKRTKELQASIEDAKKNLGETEIRDLLLALAEHYCKIGDKDNALSTFRLSYEKTVSLGHRLDIIFNLIRLGLFYSDHDLITRNIAKAKDLIEEGGDWDRRNRLKVYEATYLMSIRNFAQAAILYLDALSTFTSYELMDYETFVMYTALCAILTLDRVKLGKKVVCSPEVLEVAHEKPILGSYLKSLYDCDYAQFFTSLAGIETIMKQDRYLYAQYRFYVREMRIVSYKQLLESYRSVTVQSMASSFGVSPEFMD